MQSPNKVDEETLQALLLHLGPEKPVAGAQDPSAAETITTKPSEGLGPAASPERPADRLSGTLLSGNLAQGFARPFAGGDAEDVPDYALPDAQYIERTILPLLLRGLEEVALTRPPDPLAFLGAYLISNNPQRPTAASAAPVGALPTISTSSNATQDGARDGAHRGSPTQVLTQQQQQQQQQPSSSPFLPTNQPALAEAVQRAAERFAPYVKGSPATA
ncbi:hypothetical protein ABB37_06141 [Leptomonas pyrrhocoris]|uniref:Dpy-30 motif family protein n=1 Tax=Leptomonas pyrrhocoris TaxID=157538 RepID=A0A0M9FYL4_LEPPY|nr:hypothetical protein ABB37_06141 [Leptomonas pyrrhocoris]KPA78536.1 hypothetical protein ABB37_06141 [Leptomonas pyrrhocoris]|eukprot:XP_015656975.1 hypothetical protein ABB37_06141 [Leptomonas pyrrhocoris]